MTTPQLLKLIDDTLLDQAIKSVIEASNAWDGRRRRALAEYAQGHE